MRRRPCPPARGYAENAPSAMGGAIADTVTRPGTRLAARVTGTIHGWLLRGDSPMPPAGGAALDMGSASLPLSHHRRSGYESGIPWRRAVLFSGPAMSACLPMPQPAGTVHSEVGCCARTLAVPASGVCFHGTAPTRRSVCAVAAAVTREATRRAHPCSGPAWSAWLSPRGVPGSVTPSVPYTRLKRKGML